MVFSVLVPLLTQLAIPLGLLTWLAVGRHRTRAAWGAGVLLTVTYMATISIAGLWLVLPWFMPFVYAAMLLFVLASGARVAALPLWPRRHREWVTVTAILLAWLLTGSFAGHAVWNRLAPGPAVSLAFPMHGGTYLVVNGGGSELINAHLATLEGQRARAYRGQSYAVDLVRITRLGLRARGVLPRDPAAYQIFGDTVYAPCKGAIVRAEDTHPDMPPPQPDRSHMAGNYMLVACGNVWVLMGHLLSGSVRGATGQHVETGQVLGRVGNSGNSSEPHLHIHAQRPGSLDAPLGGAPVAIRFDDLYPARNDRIMR